MSSNDAPSFPAFTVGNDPPAHLATAGFTLNHLCLLTHDLTRMTSFYRDALGMRTIFTYSATADYTIAYFGYPHGEPSTDAAPAHQTGQDMLAAKGRREGLLEIIEVKWQAPAGFEPSAHRPNTFSHVGINVPDVRRAEQHLRSAGVSVLKGVDEPFAVEQGSPMANAFGVAADLAKARTALEAASALRLDQVLIVADPDGNMVEIQQISA